MVNGVDLRRVDRPLAVVAQLARGNGLGGDGTYVSKRKRRPVDRQRPADPGRGQQGLLGHEPARLIALGAPPPERRGKIGVAQDERDDPRVLGHLCGDGQAQRRLDEGLHGRHRRGSLDVGHRLDLGHHDGQRLEPDLAAHLEVAGLVAGVTRVHAHGDGPVAPFGAPEGVRDLLPGGGLAVYRHGVLEVEHDLARVAVERLGLHVGAVTGNDETRHNHAASL